MKNSKKTSLSSTRTQAIQCEVLSLSNSSESNSNSWKFITPSRLQKAINEAKNDLHHMLKKSVHVNDPLGTSICLKTNYVKDVMSVLPNPSQDQDKTKMKTKSTIHKPKSHSSCYKDLSFYEKKKHIELDPYVSANSSSRITTSDFQSQELQNSKGLSEEDLKWLGKNYRIQPSRKITTNDTDSESHILNEYSLRPPKSTAAVKNQIKIHETVIDFVNRVQMREQQLWKQLAEMSFTPAPSVSSIRDSSEEENYGPILLSRIPKEQNIITEGSVKHDCTETSFSPYSDEMLMSAESLISLLGDEWLKNLLKEELEISFIE